jgi:protein TonB
MNQVSALLKKIFGPLKALYNKAFDANKYAAGIGLSVLITSGLFFIMVILISLGDSGMKEDKSIKLADVVMPERQIDTFMTEVDKPEKPEEQPEDIARRLISKQAETFLEMASTYLYLKSSPFTLDELLKEVPWVMQLHHLRSLSPERLKMQLH